MESAFAALSASSPSLKFSRFSSRNPNFSFRSNSNLSFSRNLDSISIHHAVSSFSRSPFLPFGTWISASSLGRRRNDVSAEASSVPESAGDVSNANSSFIETAKLGFLVFVWYLFNIYFNIVNKQILKVYPYPITISALQYAIGAALSVLTCSFNLYEKPKIKTSQLVAILPLAIGHTLGNLFTNVSLVKVAVSFTHTIKAMEPFFTVILSALFLGEMPTLWVVSSLVPIVGGVVLASATEASFDWVGFWSAMLSNLTNQSRNVFSKKLMADKEESLDNITIFSIITIMSFFLTVPVTLYMEGIIFTPSYLQSLGLNVREIYMRFLLGGILYHAYQQISYMILQKVSPVTHSVSNSVKRVVVIVASVLFFRTPVSPINSLGTGVALLGVFFYSRVKQIKPKPKTM